MSTSAVTSQGTQLKVKINGNFVLIPQIQGFTGPSTTQDFEEITNLDSTGGFKEWFPTVRDGGTVPFTIIAKDNDSAHLHLQASSFSGAKDDFTITFTFSTAPTAWAFSGYVQKFEPQQQQSKVAKWSVELKVTGAITPTP